MVCGFRHGVLEHLKLFDVPVVVPLHDCLENTSSVRVLEDKEEVLSRSCTVLVGALRLSVAECRVQEQFDETTELLLIKSCRDHCQRLEKVFLHLGRVFEVVNIP